jgi:hypothetical protein
MLRRPTPPQLFEAYAAGEITREQLHAALAWHAGRLIEEIQQTHDDPELGWWERVLSRRAALRLTRRHGVTRVRRVLAALAEIPGFAPAGYLWNALHPDVPVHVFFRMRLRPRFRLCAIEPRRGGLEVEIEYDSEEDDLRREAYRLEHHRDGLRADPTPLR